MRIRNIVSRLTARAEWRLLGPVRYYRRRGARIGKVGAFYRPALAEPHLCEIGDNVWIAANCTFLNHDGSVVMLNKIGKTDVVNIVGKIVIRDNVFIGLGCIIMMDVEVGPNAIIAAGSVVTRDVPPNTVAGGCPARPICSLDDFIETIHDKERTLWAEEEMKIRPEVIRYFMTEGNRGKKVIRLRRGLTKWTK